MPFSDAPREKLAQRTTSQKIFRDSICIPAKFSRVRARASRQLGRDPRGLKAMRFVPNPSAPRTRRKGFAGEIGNDSTALYRGSKYLTRARLAPSRDIFRKRSISHYQLSRCCTIGRPRPAGSDLWIYKIGPMAPTLRGCDGLRTIRETSRNDLPQVLEAMQLPISQISRPPRTRDVSPTYFGYEFGLFPVSGE